MTKENETLLGNMVAIANAYKNSAEIMNIGNQLTKLLANRQGVTFVNGQPLNFDCEILPRILLYSLNIEILLKALYLVETDIQSKGHDIEMLFNNLTRERQQEIIGKMSQPYEEEAEFRKVLHDNKDIFVEWRYSYEDKGTQLNCNVSFLNQLSSALAGIIIPIVNSQEHGT